MNVNISHNSYLSHEQRQHLMALLVSLPVDCTHTLSELLPNGQCGFTISGPARLMGDIRKRLVEIVGFETPGLREYTLQEAYNIFGYRTYTDVWYRAETPTSLHDREGLEIDCLVKNMHAIIYGMSIHSGQVFARVQLTMEDTFSAYVTLHDLARDFEWPSGKPCGIVVPSKSVQKREEATGAKYRIGFD